MNRRISTRIVAGVVVAVFGIGLWTTGTTVHLAWLRFYSIAVFVAVAVLTAWDHWLWRSRFLQRFEFVPPSIRGTWKGTLTSAWIDAATGKSPPPKYVYLVIRQTFLTVSVVFFTNESRSTSTLGRVTRAEGISSLAYMYFNRPDSSVEHRSRMHHGSASLDIIGAPATRLRGRYWTDRESKGDVDFTHRDGALAGDVSSAEALFMGQP
jgi:hypothetical protein